MASPTAAASATPEYRQRIGFGAFAGLAVQTVASGQRGDWHRLQQQFERQAPNGSGPAAQRR
jgi:hypothetical protein